MYHSYASVAYFIMAEQCNTVMCVCGLLHNGRTMYHSYVSVAYFIMAEQCNTVMCVWPAS